MSAVPKRSDSAFFMEAASRTRVLNAPAEWAPAYSPGISTKAETAAESTHVPSVRFDSILDLLSKSELIISIACMIILATAVAVYSLQKQQAFIQARETQLALREIREEIGDLYVELEAARQMNDDLDLPSSLITFPVDSEDIPVLRLEPLR